MAMEVMRTICRNQFSLSIMWLPGMELRSLDLATNASPLQAIPLVLHR